MVRSPSVRPLACNPSHRPALGRQRRREGKMLEILLAQIARVVVRVRREWRRRTGALLLSCPGGDQASHPLRLTLSSLTPDHTRWRVEC